MSKPTFPIEVHGSAKQPLGMSPAAFLRDYWQQRPLLVRQAFPHFQCPTTPDDLAGLALEETALSRLVHYDRANNHWQIETGPFEEERFADLPKRESAEARLDPAGTGCRQMGCRCRCAVSSLQLPAALAL